MGVKDLRDAFNSVTGGAFTCAVATLAYQQSNGAEWQILSFSGTDAHGQPFDTHSGLLPPSTDLTQAARNTANVLIGKGV